MTVDRKSIEEAIGRAEAATSGPWTGRGFAFNAGDRSVGFCNGFQDGDDSPDQQLRGRANVRFVRHARADVPAIAHKCLDLLDENEKLKEALKEVCELAKQYATGAEENLTGISKIATVDSVVKKALADVDADQTRISELLKLTD